MSLLLGRGRAFGAKSVDRPLKHNHGSLMCEVSSNTLGGRGSLLGKSSKLFGGSRQAARICTLYHGLAVDRDLFALLEEHECWHS
jgi:hypothetical protein